MALEAAARAGCQVANAAAGGQCGPNGAPPEHPQRLLPRTAAERALHAGTPVHQPAPGTGPNRNIKQSRRRLPSQMMQFSYCCKPSSA